MIITFHGNQYIKLQTGNLVIACNPDAAEKGSKVTRFGANIVVSTNIYSGSDPRLETNQYGDTTPFCIYGPGSYEVDGLTIRGFQSLSSEKFPQEKPETIYLFSFDDIRIAFLGSIEERGQIPPEFYEAIEEVDILFINVPENTEKKGVGHVHSLITSLEPKAVVPLGYTDIKDKKIADFAKELGADNVSGEDKITLKAKDLSSTKLDVLLLKNT